MILVEFGGNFFSICLCGVVSRLKVFIMLVVCSVEWLSSLLVILC